MGKKKKKKKKTKGIGVYCSSIVKNNKKIVPFTPFEFSLLCDKIEIGKNKVEIFNFY